MRPRPIADKWRSYRRDVLPREMLPCERDELQGAFYAGATALLCFLMREAARDDDDETDAINVLIAELEAYTALVTRRAAALGERA